MEDPTLQVPGPYEDTTCQMVVAYGTRHHPHLEAIRAFRDGALADSIAGRAIIRAYYATAPAIAGIVARSETLRAVTRMFLVKPAYLIARAGNTG